jgi:hypothetical protein
MNEGMLLIHTPRFHWRIFLVGAFLTTALLTVTPAQADVIDLVTGQPCTGTTCGPFAYSGVVDAPGGTGCFGILNPFGSTLVSNFTFTALFMPSTTDNNSDLALSTIDVQGIPTVPESATLLMLGAGLLGAGRMFRKKATREDRKN